MSTNYRFRFVSGGITIDKPENLIFMDNLMGHFELYRSISNELIYVIHDERKKLYYQINKEGNGEGNLYEDVERLIRDFILN